MEENRKYISNKLKGIKRSPLSQETKNKMKETIKKNGRSGGYRYHKNGFGIKGWFENNFFDSSWEFVYYLYIRDFGIKINKNKKLFQYEYDGKTRNYLPDFIIENDIYVEIKGYESEIDKIKYNCIPNLIVIKKIDIEPIIEYIINRYDKNYVDMYSNKLKDKRDEKEKIYNLYKNQGKLDKLGRVQRNKKSYEDIKNIKNNILNSNVDFSKFGWLSKVSDILGKSHTFVRNFMKSNMEDFYKTCYSRINSER